MYSGKNNITLLIIGLFYFIVDNMLEFLVSNKEWLENRPKADLSRRPEQLKTDGSDSMDGTFKRLQID